MENIKKDFFYKKTFSALQTRRLGFFLCQKIINTNNQKKQKNIIILEGKIGSGKTVFVKGIAKQLGIRQNINSPTFCLFKTYQNNKHKLHHLDLYRLLNNESKKNNILMEIEEILENVEKGDILVIETDQDMNSFLPFWFFYVKIDFLNSTKRYFSIKKNTQLSKFEIF
ncbi:MAG: tRNA (adenosine(37)-N6)-threonylcarbamoyltransferase complex ATPase subunit type 1 TsaE [Candidatus Phytoplasma stylosanthis]|nr:tRNA (adenosine(37)-N6)-threonylcarbamoyltransferase complex ATPase subunit type 1 TsaE [Candidatus Phytoplasma stylosanthis]